MSTRELYSKGISYSSTHACAFNQQDVRSLLNPAMAILLTIIDDHLIVNYVLAGTSAVVRSKVFRHDSAAHALTMSEMMCVLDNLASGDRSGWGEGCLALRSF
jgi:hypothetical protein